MGASDLKGAFEHRPIHTLRRFYIFMRRTTPAEPSEPVEPAPPLSQTIKGRQHAHGLTQKAVPHGTAFHQHVWHSS